MLNSPKNYSFNHHIASKATTGPLKVSLNFVYDLDAVL